MNGNQPRLILFTRQPVPGRVKTRLMPTLGAEGAAALHRRLTLRAFRTAEAWRAKTNAILEIRFDGGSEAAMRHWLGDGPLYRPQGEGDLGERMARGFEENFREASPATVIIGSDCPALGTASLTATFDGLTRHRAVLGPANDGGYYLVGLTKPAPELFRGIAWGTDTVLAESVRVLEQLNTPPLLLERLDDVDRPEDLAAWRRIVEKEEADLGRVSVIIPALNEAAHIAASIASARHGQPHEIIVADGSSTDGTAELAREAGAMVISSAPGRARQMNTGAARATGNALLFLHSDTRLPPGYQPMVPETLSRPGVAAGAFRFRVGENFAGKALVEWGINLRSYCRQMPYGDQAVFLRRALFEEMGGFADMPFLEDIEFVRRLRKRGRIETLSASIITSGRRWQQHGVFRTTLFNQLVLTGYSLGMSPATLARFYRRAVQ
jgi:rSAM/selenodomain-associated transferase 2/rSAM/selenodomain-associated transferase 1